MKNIFIISALAISFVQLYAVEKEASLEEPRTASNTMATSSITHEGVMDFISERMNDDYYRTSLIEAVTQVPSEHLQAFYKILNHVLVPYSGPCSGWGSGATKALYRSRVCAQVSCFTAATYLLTPAFINAVDHFMQDVDDGDTKRDIVSAMLHDVASAVATVLRGRLTSFSSIGEVIAERIESLEVEVDLLSQGMDMKSKAKVLDAVLNVPVERLESLEVEVDLLSQGMDGYSRASVMQAIAKVPTKCLQEFYNILSSFLVPSLDPLLYSFGDAIRGRRDVIKCLAPLNVIIRLASYYFRASADLTQEMIEFRHFAISLSQGMDEDDKYTVIAALLRVPVEHLASDFFEDEVNRLSKGMDGENKAKVIATVAKMPLP